MKVLFVHIVHDTTLSYSHAIASLGAVLADKSSVDVALHVVRNEDMHLNIPLIMEHEPDVVMVTCMSNQWANAAELARLLRIESPHIRTVVGGSHVIASPESARTSAFDYAVVGEGEMILDRLLALVETKAPESCTLINGEIVDELDSLPLPFVGLFEVEDVLAYPSVMFSRGCPYRCTYCMSRLGGLGGRIRWKSPQRAIQEVVDMVGHAMPAEIFIDDDTFLKNPAWLKEFCAQYRERELPGFYCNARPETVKHDVCESLVAAGCKAIGIGIESGSEVIRREVLDRRMSDQRIIDAFDAVHAAGMKTWSFNMVGIPGESPEDLISTIVLNDRVNTDYVRVSIYTPYPGTPLHPESSIPYARGYIHPDAALSDEMAEIYREWLSRLEAEGRLWFTKSEADLVEVTLSSPEIGL